jgi:hypothetical protein
LGGLFTVVVGCVLIGLLFYSSRHGYDDEAFKKRRDPKLRKLLRWPAAPGFQHVIK